MTIDDLRFDSMKNWCLHNVDILEKVLKGKTLNKIYIAEKDDFEILKLPYFRSYFI